MTTDERDERLRKIRERRKEFGTGLTDIDFLLSEVERLREHNESLRLAVNGCVAWAKSAYQWEGFWYDVDWKPESAANKNGKKLRDFLKHFEDVLQDKDASERLRSAILEERDACAAAAEKSPPTAAGR